MTKQRAINKILIANRGEIACRVIRACRELSVRSVAVYSDADRGAMHVRMADEAHHIGPPAARESYLDIDKVVATAKRAGADAIHPGYGFLSERAEFVEAVDRAGLIFIGPSAQAMRTMGEKTRARIAMSAAGVPVVPGDNGADGRGFPTSEEALAAARRVGFPVMLKAAAGGGGKGMRLVDDEARFVAAYEGARRDLQGRGFLGFAFRAWVDSRDGTAQLWSRHSAALGPKWAGRGGCPASCTIGVRRSPVFPPVLPPVLPNRRWPSFPPRTSRSPCIWVSRWRSRWRSACSPAGSLRRSRAPRSRGRTSVACRNRSG